MHRYGHEGPERPTAELSASFIKLTAMIPDEASAVRYTESVRWPEGPYCPECGNVNVWHSHKRGRPFQWKCECGKQFTVTTGTVMHSTKLPLRTWLIAYHLIASARKGISAKQLQELLDIKQYRSAWHLAHRIRAAIERDPDAPPMKGIIESDEVYIGGRRKGMGRGYRKNKAAVQVILQRGRSKTRHGTRRYGSGIADRGVAEGHSIAQAVILSPDAENVDARTVGRHIRDNVDTGRSRLMTDETPIYGAVGREFKSHERVHHKKGDYAHVEPLSGRLVSTNEAEGYFGNLRRQITGTHHHTSKRHLPRYLKEFDYKFNRRELSGGERMVATVKNADGRRLTLYQGRGGRPSLRGRRGATGRKLTERQKHDRMEALRRRYGSPTPTESAEEK